MVTKNTIGAKINGAAGQESSLVAYGSHLRAG